MTHKLKCLDDALMVALKEQLRRLERTNGWGHSPAPVRRVSVHHGAPAYRATETARPPAAGWPSPRQASSSRKRSLRRSPASARRSPDCCVIAPLRNPRPTGRSSPLSLINSAVPGSTRSSHRHGYDERGVAPAPDRATPATATARSRRWHQPPGTRPALQGRHRLGHRGLGPIRAYPNPQSKADWRFQGLLAARGESRG